mgnify:CR=1 FL=1
MTKFGIIKTKLLTKLTESYAKENKAEIKELLTTIKENKDFKNLYLFYEEIENKYIEDKEIAKLYVEGLNNYFSQPVNDLASLNMFCEALDKKLGDIKVGGNELYESIDQIAEKDSLSNIEKKVIAKKKLIEHLTTKKEVAVTESTVYTQNENLLHAILANNFNVLYDNTLSEEEKSNLKDILSITNEDLETKVTEIKEAINTQLETLLNESNDTEMKSKLEKVKQEVNSKEVSRLNYYRLTELKNGLI